MIKNIFALCFLTSLVSCVNNPIKFHPPKKSSAAVVPKREVVPVPKPSSVVTSTPVVRTNENGEPTTAPAVQTNTSSATSAVVLVDAPEIKPLPPEVNQRDSLLNVFKNSQAQRTKIVEAINDEDRLKEIETVLEFTPQLPGIQAFRSHLLNRAAEIALGQRQPELAIQFYRSLVSQFPQSPFAQKAQSEIALIQASQETDAKVIGAILPLTGKNANIGQHALNSIRIALGLNKDNAKFRLALFDSQGSADLARTGVDKLIRDDKAIAIIGGLSSKEAISAGERADLFGVPFVALSQKSGLTNIGDYVFRNSLTPEMQVDRLVQFASEQLGAKKFGVLYPNDAYGVEFANIYWDHVLARGGRITAAQMYDPKANDFTEVVQKLVGTFHVEARADEYKARLKEIEAEKKEKKDKNKPKSSRVNEVQENILPPIIDFDVLFIPDTGKSLGQVMAFMKVNDVPQMTYLGTNIWNNPDLSKRAGVHANSVYFIDAIDLADTSIRETEFFREYFAEYNEEPTLIEMQAYEAARIIRGVISSGANSRSELANDLRSLGRSNGVTGQLRMSNQRELERPLHILSLDAGQIKKIE